MNLAEKEREGGLSPNTSPMIGLSEIGNMMSRIGFKLPTIDKTITNAVFEDMIDLVEICLQEQGDQNSMLECWDRKPLDTFIAASSIYKTLFNCKNIKHDAV